MITLAMDTSGKTLSVALAKDRTLLAEASLALGYRHSVTFQPLVQDLLTRCDLKMGQVDLFVLAHGPGSFTGIRIGLAAVKAMAYASHARTMGISSLRALARSAGPYPGLVAPLLDARGGRVYASLYRQDQELMAEAPRPIALFLEGLAPLAGPSETILVTGDGIPVLEAGLAREADLPYHFLMAPAHARFIRASALIDLALDDLEGGRQAVDPMDLEASYLLASSAERSREAGHD